MDAPEYHADGNRKSNFMQVVLHGKTTVEMSFWDRPMAGREIVLSLIAGIVTVGFVGYVFYSRVPAVLALLPLGFAAVPLYARKRASDEKERFLLQFKDLLYYLSVSLSAGKSLQSSLLDASISLAAQYGRSDTLLMMELSSINERLAIREPVDLLLGELADRTGLEDVRSLADVVSVCRKSGGNLVEVMRQSVRILREKMEICREMETSWAAKKLEQRLLSVSPVFLILIVRMGSGDFMEPMYGTAAGRIIMTVALLMVVAGYVVGDRMMKVRI